MQNLELHDTGIIADMSTLKLGLKLILAFNIDIEDEFFNRFDGKYMHNNVVNDQVKSVYVEFEY